LRIAAASAKQQKTAYQHKHHEGRRWRASSASAGSSIARKQTSKSIAPAAPRQQTRISKASASAYRAISGVTTWRIARQRVAAFMAA